MEYRGTEPATPRRMTVAALERLGLADLDVCDADDLWAVLEERGWRVVSHTKASCVVTTAGVLEAASGLVRETVKLRSEVEDFLSTVRAASYEEALKLAMDHEYGNGTAIFTRDGDTARDFASRCNIGMVGINVPIPVPLAYFTFGGWKKSGFGDLNQHGPDAFRFYTRTKTVTERWFQHIEHGAETAFKAMD